MKPLIPLLINGKLPPLGGSDALRDASLEELRILLCLLEAGRVTDRTVAELARAAGCGTARTRSALRYWLEVGVLTYAPEEESTAEGTASGVERSAVRNHDPAGVPHGGKQAAPDEQPQPVATSEKETVTTPPSDDAGSQERHLPTGGILPAPDGKTKPNETAPEKPADRTLCAGSTQTRAEDAVAKPDLSAAAGSALRGAKEKSGAAVDAAALIRDRNLSAFLDSCQTTVGRLFNTAELIALTDLLDRLPFSEEYLLTLISYCKRKTERFSFAYLEKTALAMLERDCLTLEQLNAYLAAEDRFSSEEWKLRRLLGIGERRLGSREKACLLRWTGEFGYGEAVIGIAYDITVNQTGKVSLPYMDKLLTRFHEAGCTDEKSVQEFLERERAEHVASAPRRGGNPKSEKSRSFSTGVSETDPSGTRGSNFRGRDYLTAALQRSYGDAGFPDKKEKPDPAKADPAGNRRPGKTETAAE